MSCNAFISKSCVSIKKNVFMRGFGWFGGKDDLQKYVLHTLKQCYSIIANFGLWMLKGAHDFLHWWLALWVKSGNLNILQQDCLKQWNYKVGYGKKFNWIVRSLWFNEEENYCIC
jgi:hypothetical protein